MRHILILCAVYSNADILFVFITGAMDYQWIRILNVKDNFFIIPSVLRKKMWKYIVQLMYARIAER